MHKIDPIRLDVERSDHSYPIRFERLSKVPELLPEVGLNPGNCVLVTDENVDALYGNEFVDALLSGGWTPVKVVVPPGEASKSIDQLSTIYDAVLSHQIDRQTPVLALGGGVVGDLAGFAASSLLRGVPLVHLPTTLIGQADSAIGGKTGINHASGKNLIGAFYQPHLVCADLETLQSLPEREWTSGLAEVVKYAYISDPQLFTYLEEHWKAVRNRRPEAIAAIVPRSAAIKTQVVESDEREAGRRAILNFGHTVGHAVEKAGGYGTFTHGEAIALGMVAALHLSHHYQPDLAFERLRSLVERLPIPHTLDNLSFDEIWHVMQSDKKVKDGQVHYILLQELGAPYISGDVSQAAVREAWRYTKTYAASHAAVEDS